KLEKDFYKHFCNLLVEGIKNLSISQRDLMQRFSVTNPELLDELYAKKQSVILISGHYGNWEWLITAQAALFQHKAFGIGMPLTSNFWNDKLNEKRSRFGMTVLNAKNYKAALKNSSQPFAVLTLGDQAPPFSEKAYWTNFLNQQSPVLLGTEFMANEFNAAVVYFSIIPVKRGYYNMTLTLITDDPRSCPFGYVTENHTRLLEHQIMTQPSYWLWTHKRWKRSLPVNLEALRESQEKAFNERFRS
ncbi:MAG: lysophospholipid acyltransferase family protein, partial [Crocinitomicaceae bacterium]